MEKSAIFIDAGYLRQIQKKLGHNKPLDYLKFCNKLEKMTGTKRLRTYYYDCKPFSGSNPDKKTQERIINAEKFL